MKYFVVDGYLNGTGVRDKHNGGYVNLDEINLSASLISKINNWLSRYWDEFYLQYPNDDIVNALDEEGLMIVRLLKYEVPNSKVEYFSDAKMSTLKSH